MTGLFPFLIAFGLSLVLTPLVRRLAHTRRLVALPSQDRWKQTPVALLGGVGLAAAFFSGALLWGRPDPTLWALVAASLAIAALGLYDDIAGLRPHTKLVGQIVAAAVLTEFGYQLCLTDWRPVNVLLTLFWLVGLTNAFNLLDNMDGLSAGVGAIGAGFTWVLCAQVDAGSMTVAAAALTGALLGFLPYNFNPATIFMGDCGSMLVGLTLGGIIIANECQVTKGFSPLAVLLVPASVFLIPIFDTTYVTVMRVLWGRKVSEGGRDHTSHRLVSLGLPEPQAVIVLYVLAVLAGGLGLLIRFRAVWTATLLVPLYMLLLVILGVYLSKVAVYRSEARRPQAPAEPKTPLWHAVKYKRRMFEVFLDLFLIGAAYFGAQLLRWEGQLEGHQLELFIQSLPLVIACQLAACWVFGVYRGVWRYTGLDEVLIFIKAVVAGVALTVLVLVFAFRFQAYSRSVFVIDAMLLLLLLSASRISFRLLDRVLRTPNGKKEARRVLIYGAGDAGELAVREMLNNQRLHMEPIGYIDDDPLKLHRHIHGFPVLGSVADLERILRERRVTDMLLSSQYVNGANLERAKEVCRRLGIPLKRLSIRFVD